MLYGSVYFGRVAVKSGFVVSSLLGRDDGGGVDEEDEGVVAVDFVPCLGASRVESMSAVLGCLASAWASMESNTWFADIAGSIGSEVLAGCSAFRSNTCGRVLVLFFTSSEDEVFVNARACCRISDTGSAFVCCSGRLEADWLSCAFVLRICFLACAASFSVDAAAATLTGEAAFSATTGGSSGTSTDSALSVFVRELEDGSFSSTAAAVVAVEVFTDLFLVVVVVVDAAAAGLLVLTAALLPVSLFTFLLSVVDDDFLAVGTAATSLPAPDFPRVFCCGVKGLVGTASTSTMTLLLLSVVGDTAFLAGRPRFLTVTASADILFLVGRLHLGRY